MTTFLFIIGAAAAVAGVALLSIEAGLIVGGTVLAGFAAALEYGGRHQKGEGQ